MEGLERFADRLHFFGFDEAALAGTASVVRFQCSLRGAKAII